MTHRFILALTALLAISAAAYATDDFGPRFANETPAAFSDQTATDAIAATTAEESVDSFMGDMNDIADQLQNIMPAAGEETPIEASEIEIQNTNSDTQIIIETIKNHE